MIKLFCILVGLYLVIDALYLASHSSHENRTCLIAKYVGAAMSGAYFVWLSGKDLVVQYGLIELDNHLFISNDAAQIMLLFCITIALFMWPDTFFRILNWLQIKHVNLYASITSRYNVKPRRRTD